LFGAEIGPVKNLLQTNDMAALFGGLFEKADVLLNHGLFNDVQGRGAFVGAAGLNQSSANYSWHNRFSTFGLWLPERVNLGKQLTFILA